MTAAELTNISERAYAELLDAKGIPWTRPRFQAFKFAGTSYTPDFYLPVTCAYVEIIGSRQRKHQLMPKLETFRHLFPHVVLEVVDVSCKRQALARWAKRAPHYTTGAPAPQQKGSA